MSALVALLTEANLNRGSPLDVAQIPYPGWQNVVNSRSVIITKPSKTHRFFTVSCDIFSHLFQYYRYGKNRFQNFSFETGSFYNSEPEQPGKPLDFLP
jgi:hypothetical protein